MYVPQGAASCHHCTVYLISPIQHKKMFLKIMLRGDRVRYVRYFHYRIGYNHHQLQLTCNQAGMATANNSYLSHNKIVTSVNTAILILRSFNNCANAKKSKLKNVHYTILFWFILLCNSAARYVVTLPCKSQWKLQMLHATVDSC